jgi:hypothetical protein
MNCDGAGDRIPKAAPALASALSFEPNGADRRSSGVHKNGTRPRRRRQRSNGTLSLVEQFPQIDWSPAIEAAAGDERRRVAALR